MMKEKYWYSEAEGIDDRVLTADNSHMQGTSRRGGSFRIEEADFVEEAALKIFNNASHI